MDGLVVTDPPMWHKYLEYVYLGTKPDSILKWIP